MSSEFDASDFARRRRAFRFAVVFYIAMFLLAASTLLVPAVRHSHLLWMFPIYLLLPALGAWFGVRWRKRIEATRLTQQQH